jgi:hypothetical protein
MGAPYGSPVGNYIVWRLDGLIGKDAVKHRNVPMAWNSRHARSYIDRFDIVAIVSKHNGVEL